MRKALIENGVVTNIILAGEDFEPSNVVLVSIKDEQEQVAIGDFWDGDAFIKPGPEPEPDTQIPTTDERIEALELAMLELVLGGGA